MVLICLLNFVLSFGNICKNFFLFIFFEKFFGNMFFILMFLNLSVKFILCVRISNLCVIFVFDKLLCGLGLVKFFFFVSKVVFERFKFFFSLLKIKESEFDKIFLNFLILLFVVSKFCKFLIIGKFVFMFVLYKNLCWFW